MFCNRCGTPLRAGDRFCPRCGAAIDSNRPASGAHSQAPWLDQPDRPPRRSRAVGIVIAMLVMVALLLAAAAWSQRDALSGLFDPEPMPTARPGQQGAEKVAQEHPATDDAGVPWIDPDPAQPEQDMARALLADAAEDAFFLLYGEDAVSRSEAKESFCNLTAGGYENSLEKAMELNGTTTGTLSRWDGYALSRPLMAGNCGYLAVLFYSVKKDDGQLGLETESSLLCFLWTGREWRLDASDAARELWPKLFERQLSSDGLRRAVRGGRVVLQFGQDTQLTRLARPVIPGVCDAIPTEVFQTEKQSVTVEFWAFNGTDTPLALTTLAEVSLKEEDGTVCFALYDLAIEPLQLRPGEGQLVTVTIPPEELQADLGRIKSGTCGVWLTR